jgi:hypothetical protein
MFCLQALTPILLLVNPVHSRGKGRLQQRRDKATRAGGQAGGVFNPNCLRCCRLLFVWCPAAAAAAAVCYCAVS